MMKSRVVRVDDALWAAAGERAALLGFSTAEFIRRCVQHGIIETESAATPPIPGEPMWIVPADAVVKDADGEWTISASHLTDATRLNQCEVSPS